MVVFFLNRVQSPMQTGKQHSAGDGLNNKMQRPIRAESAGISHTQTLLR